MNNFNLSEETRQALKIAQSLAKENTAASYTGAHLIKALMHNEIGLAPELVASGKDVNYIKDWADYRIESEPKSTGPVSEPPADKSINKVLELADINKIKLGLELINPMCTLIALLRPEIAFNADQLKTLNVSEKELIELNVENNALGLGQSDDPEGTKPKSGGTPNSGSLLKFCTDKTAEAKEEKFDAIIGRESELRRLKEIIGRRTKPNVIIVGEPGVGKSALIEGFALDLAKDNVPEFLTGASLLELDLGGLIAGASYKGEIEDRLKKIIGELKSQEHTILFIDEIHTLLDSKAGFGGAANLLKPELARGEITVIGATTNEEYRKYIESDDAFSRRFDVVKVDEPTEHVAFQMLKKVVPYYVEHHSLEVEDEAIKSAIGMCTRYLKDRRLPDAAVDLLDQTMAAVKMMHNDTERQVAALEEQLTEINESQDIEDFLWFSENMKGVISPVLLEKLDGELAINNKMSATQAKELLATQLAEVKELYKAANKTTITKDEVGAIVAQKTGIPLGKLQSDEKQKLLELEAILNKRVVGQNHALGIISEAIRESRAGLLKEGQPIGSFFFMGPTGTGKTELAKTMADFLFNDEKALIRFDMSEFKEEHSVALLYGAPPGYVGYEQGGLLVNKIRQQPYSIVLFDEIEKAHPSVFDLFLQILDEGKLSDRLGKEGDFSNAIILFTSNIGSDFIIEEFNAGNVPSANVLMDRMSDYFRPEFLARITEIVPFSPIQEQVVLLIFDIQLKHLINTLKEKEIQLEVSDDAKKKIAMEGFNQKYGARPLKGKIRNLIRRPISRMIIADEVGPGSKIKLGLNDSGEISWEVE